MSQERLYVLVNTLSSHPERDFILCDKEGEIHKNLADALTARNIARAEFDNPWIQVFRLQDIDASDLGCETEKYTLPRLDAGDLLSHRCSEQRPYETKRFWARFGAKN
jgi:hypothetical protein